MRTVKEELKSKANPEKAKILSGFFKTGKGEYGEGDVFLGITVPQQRAVAKKFVNIPLTELQKLLASKVHEHRFTALEILVMKYECSNLLEKKTIADFYLRNAKNINNWDLVDTSAEYVLGDWLHDKDKTILDNLARSENIW